MFIRTTSGVMRSSAAGAKAAIGSRSLSAAATTGFSLNLTDEQKAMQVGYNAFGAW
jgi:hypothetical protein